jgi:NAD(P)-dependent dehydrogenase (short-subunit alcohol dehydrogenase family)
MFDFTDQVVIVTGAAGSLGEATARAFRDAGAQLILIDLKLEDLEDTFSDLAEADDHLLVAADLTDAGTVESSIYEAVQQFGRVDVLANIAGGFTMGPPVHETDVETWDHMLDMNARTAFLTSRAVIPHMLQQGAGRIISVSARAALAGAPKMAPYIISKTAVRRLTESMSAELKDKGINVNCIMPGTIDTPANREMMPDADFDKWAPPAALADVILFLASDAARAVTGAAVPVFGRS